VLLAETTHRQSFLDILSSEIWQKASADDLSFQNAASRILMQWLGYDIEEGVTFIDAKDRGIDAWVGSEVGLDIFQVKSHEPHDIGKLQLGLFDGKGISDLERAKLFIVNEKASQTKSDKLQKVLLQRDSLIDSFKIVSTTNEISINLHLIILGDDITQQAHSEFSAFQTSNLSPMYIEEVPVKFHGILHTVNNIINVKWREENRTWNDKHGKPHEKILLRIWNEGGVISDNANAVFYCQAMDLVKAYDLLGYQIFEPNVRANIKNSRVNQAIKESIMHQKTRRDFRFLNNGITMICDNFKKPSKPQQPFSVIHPGIVNGLQTVVALHTAYQQLEGEERIDFDKNCSVLVRLLLSNAVDDITKVVKATNNQNPMKLRNLVSNSIEQITYARLFAEQLGWFYEAKEGAWDAFEKDYKRWRPTLRKNPRDFKVPPHRKKIRRLDNEQLAQTWLAFIGFANEASNDKKSLFDDRLYSFIFAHQTPRHGFDYDFSLARAEKDLKKGSPDIHLMLASYLVRDFAKEMPLSPAQNRQNACDRLGISLKAEKAFIDEQLHQDSMFLLNQALSGMSFLFTEFVGFVLYQAFREDLQYFGSKIIANYSFSSLKEEVDYESVKEKIIQKTFDPHDILIILWLAFVSTVDDLINSDWGQSYRAATVKVRFLFSKETRERLYKKIQKTDEWMKKRVLTEQWTIGVPEKQGLFDFIRGCVIIGE
jgi:hypothetical protein